MSNRYENTVKKMAELARGRQFILWGTNELSLYIYEDFCEMGFDIKYFVSDEDAGKEIMGKEVRASIELFYEDKAEVYIVAFAFQGHGSIYQKLIEMGYEYRIDFFVGNTGGYYEDYDVIDSFLGFNRYYGDMLGFDVLGDNEPTDKVYKILTLGGSTTDPSMGNNKSWSNYLYERLKVSHSNIQVMNGGIVGYATNQEFLKFVRDGMALRPNMVITFDGVNDVSVKRGCVDYPFLHPYTKKVYDYIENKGDFAPDTMGIRNATEFVHGLPQSDKTDYERWIGFQKKIHAIADAFDVVHVGFLQPMITMVLCQDLVQIKMGDFSY